MLKNYLRKLTFQKRNANVLGDQISKHLPLALDNCMQRQKQIYWEEPGLKNYRRENISKIESLKSVWDFGWWALIQIKIKQGRDHFLVFFCTISWNDNRYKRQRIEFLWWSQNLSNTRARSIWFFFISQFLFVNLIFPEYKQSSNWLRTYTFS